MIYARLDWTNEAQVVKSGFAVVLTMVICFLLAIPFTVASVAGIIIHQNTLMYLILGGEVILMAGLCAGAYAIITHYGVRKYESLNG